MIIYITAGLILYTNLILTFIIITYKYIEMTLYTNINIEDNNHSFKYMIEYEDSSNIMITNDLRYYLSYIHLTNSNCVNFFDKYSNIMRNGNVWVPEIDKDLCSYLYLPKQTCGCDSISKTHITSLIEEKDIVSTKQSNCDCEDIYPDKVKYIWDNDDFSKEPTKPQTCECCKNIDSNEVYGWFSEIGENYNGEESVKVDQISNYKTAKLRLYFPQFSVDTYTKGVKYALTVNTWIHGYRVVLGCYLISRIDALATPMKRKFANNYHEYVEFDIINPWDLTYSNEWDKFRKNICNEAVNTNSIGSILNFSLYPIMESSNEEYIILDGYQGGQNSINITKSKNDYLYLNISTNIDKYSEECDPNKDTEDVVNYIYDWKPSVVCSLGFNNVYDDLKDYLLETYNIKSTEVKINYELVIKDSDNIYASVSQESDDVCCKFFNIGVNDDSQYNIINWGWYDEYHKNHKDNLVIQCIASISVKYDEDFNECLYLKSNELPLTQELFSYFVNTEDIKYINLNNVNMNLYTINAVNKTVNEIYQLNNPTDAKSNIIQPVFFKARDAANIILHPAVTENICINLDGFKSKVKTFMIQIEGCSFTEIGRVPVGVIFKVVGTKLPNTLKEGIYYILNEDGELVTNGKYKYDE